MSDFKFEVNVAPGFRADAVVEDTIFEVKRHAREVSRLRGTLWELAQVAAANPGKRVVLVLHDPELSPTTIGATWSSVTQVLRADLAGRMAIWTFIDESDVSVIDGFPAAPTGEDGRLLKELLASLPSNERFRGPTHGDSLSEVLRLLLYRWLKDEGPITLTAIGGLLGYTFKPVRAALDVMERYLALHGKRGVTLGSFPREPWARLVHNSRAVRGTINFVDRAQSGRTPESLLQRFRRLALTNVAVGGVEGARRYDADLDLLGLPRLDLCIHLRTSKPDLGFVRTLDPGLVAQSSAEEAGPLAVHFIYRKMSLFDHGWADPVECLLDLHEMRLEGQALQFLRSFPNARSESF